MSRGPLPPKCCFKCGNYISPPDDSHGRADIGLCKEGNGREVVEVNERDCCKYFLEDEE
jgi:hypothetical protein